MRERVWKIRRFVFLKVMPEVVISRLRRQSDFALRELYPELPGYGILLIAKHNETLDRKKNKNKNKKRPLRINFEI